MAVAVGDNTLDISHFNQIFDYFLSKLKFQNSKLKKLFMFFCSCQCQPLVLAKVFLNLVFLDSVYVCFSSVAQFIKEPIAEERLPVQLRQAGFFKRKQKVKNLRSLRSLRSGTLRFWIRTELHSMAKANLKKS